MINQGLVVLVKPCKWFWEAVCIFLSDSLLLNCRNFEVRASFQHSRPLLCFSVFRRRESYLALIIQDDFFFQSLLSQFAIVKLKFIFLSEKMATILGRI